MLKYIHHTSGLVYMDFKDYVEGEMEYYEEYYAELNILLKEYGYDCDMMDIEYTTAD